MPRFVDYRHQSHRDGNGCPRSQGSACTPLTPDCALEDPPLTRGVFEACRKRALRAFSRCTDSQLLRASIIVSCLLHCLRPLHKSEVTSILTVAMVERDEQDWDHKSGEEIMLEWLETHCNSIFLVDASGQFCFACDDLPKFFLRWPIKGLDRTACTLTKLCLERMLTWLGRPERIREQVGEKSLLAYARDHWVIHYARVQGSVPGLDAKVHAIFALEQRVASVSEMTFDQLRIVLQQCKDYGFRVLETFYKQLLPFAKSSSSSPTTMDHRPQSHITEMCLTGKLEDLELDDSGYISTDSQTEGDWSLIKRTQQSK